MNAKDSIKFLLEANENMISMYLSDLSDADLLVRPVPGANHIAWQLGHLIASEASYFLPKIPGSKPPELPAGFAQQHSKETINSDCGFLKKDEYLALFKKVRAVTLATSINSARPTSTRTRAGRWRHRSASCCLPSAITT